MNEIERQLHDMGLALPAPASPAANYLPFVRTGNLLFVSGQICFDVERKIPDAFKGKVGDSVSLETAQQAARTCAVNILAQVKAAVGDLDRVVRCVRLGGFVNSTPTFGQLPKVMDGASDLLVALFGDRGRHARSTVGVAQLPGSCAVEVEGVFEIE